jgi:hypothetical protein
MQAEVRRFPRGDGAVNKLCRFICIPIISAAAIFAEGVDPRFLNPDVAVLTDFGGRHSETTIQEMKREFGGLLKSSGLRFHWSDLKKSSGQTFSNVVIVRFQGACTLEGMKPIPEATGPFGFAHVTDGQVLPFIEIRCDRIRQSAYNAMWGEDYRKRDELMGRAIARVLAHEFEHVMRNKCEHASHGIFKESISGKALISKNSPVEPAGQ